MVGVVILKGGSIDMEVNSLYIFTFNLRWVSLEIPIIQKIIYQAAHIPFLGTPIAPLLANRQHSISPNKYKSPDIP
jgi:hypothetical protein